MEKKTLDVSNIKDGLYIVNGKRTLYRQDGVWYKAIYQSGRYTGNILPLEKQPKIIKELYKLHY